MLFGNADATHLYGGEITVIRISPMNSTFRIILTVYVNLESAVLFGGEDDWLSFGDGTRILVPEKQAVPRFDLPDGIGVATFEVEHTYTGFKEYAISYTEPNWQEGIKNIDSSVSTRMVLTTYLSIDPVIQHHPLKFLFSPIMQVASGDAVTAAMSADNSDGHVVYYELITPAGVQNYRLPEGASINPFNGLFTWDTKFQGNFVTGGFLFCVKATGWNNDDQRYSYTTRTFMINVVSNETEVEISGPELDENNRLLLHSDYEKIILTENSPAINPSTVEYSIASELTGVTSALTFTQYDSAIGNQQSKVGRIVINYLDEIDRDNPYIVATRVKFVHGEDVFFQDHVLLVYTRDLLPELPIILDASGHANEHDVPVFPNPVRNTLHFDEALYQNVVTITDAAGKPVATKQRDEKHVDMSSVPPGLYYLMVDDKRVQTKKIIKQ